MHHVLGFPVDAGEQAVMFNRFGGVSNKIRTEGTHFRFPWFQNPHIYNVRTRATSISTTTGTKGYIFF
jgi:regulator of protease activity HflC (stomatin/prohibitin superfamily)